MLFGGGAGLAPGPSCTGFARFGAFCNAPFGNLELARLVGAALLVLVASGWRPRITGPIHAYITVSVAMNVHVLDGGDTVAANLALLLVPFAVSDPRRWQWRSLRDADPHSVKTLVAIASTLCIQLQVAWIYIDSAIAKLGVEEWANGTAVYYVVHDPMLGAPRWAQMPVLSIVASPTGVVVMTWGTIALEIALGIALLLPRAIRAWLLLAGILFHACIGLLIGIETFGLVMIGALIGYIGGYDALLGRKRRVRPRVSIVADHGDELRLVDLARGACTLSGFGDDETEPLSRGWSAKLP